MLKNYFKIASHNPGIRGGSSIITIIGLAMGIVSVIVIMLFVLHEKSYEKFYKNAGRIVRISPADYARTSPWLSAALKKDIPGVENAVRLVHLPAIVKAGTHGYNEERALFADADFLNMFSYDLTAGNSDKALQNIGSMVISQSTAEKYFGSQNSLGKIVYLRDTIPLTITGIYKDLPTATHLKADMVISFATCKIAEVQKNSPDNDMCYTYALLRRDISTGDFQDELNDYVSKNIGGLPNRKNYQLQAQNICDIHLSSNKAMELEPNGRNSTLQVFISVALFILLIACINYINVSLISASGKEKYFQKSRTIMASGTRIYLQPLTGSIFNALLAFIMALVISILFLPALNSLTGIDVKANDLLQGGLLFFVFGFVIMLGFFAGIYPATILSSFRPGFNLVPGNLREKQKSNTRQAIVAVQFALSLILVIGTIIIYQQLNFVKRPSSGYDKEHVLVLPFKHDGKVAYRYKTIQNKLMEEPVITYANSKSAAPVTE